ncbi:MAG: M20 family metallo-hydrolase [Desulfovibrionaceae bacterium]|nr:M20 family metallo-hydrolase [Desulfovibrionaceae bacterium]
MDEQYSQHFAQIVSLLQSQASVERIIDLQTHLTHAHAVPPEHGGQGEYAKALFVEQQLQKCNVANITHLDAKDARVPEGLRPNIIAHIPGDTDQTLWLFGHLDVVDAGDLSAWASDPFVVRQDGDWLYGRGVEDNQQALTSMLLLAWALSETGLTPKRSLGLVFMADEENGNTFGIKHILQEAADLFKPTDLYVVPDFGSSDAKDIEIAEKAALWLRIEVQGKQCHASTPEKGKNAFVAAAELVTHLHNRLPELYPTQDSLFTPPSSTFVPSLHETSVNAINIVPGKDVFYLDCRLLPTVSPQAVLKSVKHIVAAKAQYLGVKATVSVVLEKEACQIACDDPSIAMLSTAIKDVYQVEAVPMGLGGGTVAAELRFKGLPALVWACLENTCHQPNERSSITATGRDSCVFAHLLFS